MKSLLLMLLFFCLPPLMAREITVTSSNYKEALSKENFIKFDMESTKIGFITDDFTGVARQFRVSFDEQKNLISKIVVVVPIKGLDTDINMRNEKMWETCFSATKYPELKVDLPGPVTLQEGVSNLEGYIQIRGLFYPISIKLELKKREGGMSATGTAHVSLKQTNIPDPSIFIASVRDRIDLSFHLNF